MRRCVFYFDAARLAGRADVDWIVCKECQAKLQRGTLAPAPQGRKGALNRVSERLLDLRNRLHLRREDLDTMTAAVRHLEDRNQ